jgi:hypothetical protein
MLHPDVLDRQQFRKVAAAIEVAQKHQEGLLCRPDALTRRQQQQEQEEEDGTPLAKADSLVGSGA